MSLPMVSPADEAEAQRLRQQLHEKEELLIERELFLATCRSQLLHFQRLYMDRVGSLYVKLDEIRAQRERRYSRQHPGDPEAARRADEAARQADKSRSEFEEQDAALPIAAKLTEPSAQLKDLYRRLAKKCHPDLTTDPSEKAFRHEVMCRIREAYDAGDLEALRRIEAETAEHAIPSPVQGLKRELRELKRRLAQLNARLAAVEQELTELQASELWRLFQQWKEWQSRGEDLLEKLASALREQIEREQPSSAS